MLVEIKVSRVVIKRRAGYRGKNGNHNVILLVCCGKLTLKTINLLFITCPISRTVWSIFAQLATRKKEYLCTVVFSAYIQLSPRDGKLLQNIAVSSQ